MHNLAIALKQEGWEVTGSDDVLFEPSSSRLEAQGLKPAEIGWFPEKINKELDYVIVGMHARPDNPELLKANSLDLNVVSFPDFVRQQSENKQRVVIAGSHGKTTITAMIMHVLKYFNRDFDYLVGAQIKGFDNMVRISQHAPLIIIEGDEYPSSPQDSAPKFLKYEHHIALISGIAWDHFNVYPDFDTYVKQFEMLADASPKAGVLVFCEDDDLVSIICKNERADVTQLPYSAHKYEIKDNVTYLIDGKSRVPVKVFGYHNMQNINGAKTLLGRLGITESMFYEAIQSFEGADRRLQLLAANNGIHIYKDFAHAPSKLKASTEAVKNQYKAHFLVAVLELHTYSSLNKAFIDQYRGTFDQADEAIVYFNPETVAHKKLEQLTEDQIRNAFGRQSLKVFSNITELEDYLRSVSWFGKNLLFMSSGNFDNMDLTKLAKDLSGSES